MADAQDAERARDQEVSGGAMVQGLLDEVLPPRAVGAPTSGAGGAGPAAAPPSSPSEEMVERVAQALRDAELDEDAALAAMAKVFGPRFTADDVRAALAPNEVREVATTTRRRGLRRTTTVSEVVRPEPRTIAVRTALKFELGVELPSDLTDVLAAAWVASLPREPMHLASAFGRLVDDALGTFQGDDAQRARERLVEVGGIAPARERVPVERAEVRHSGVAEARALRKDPSAVRPVGAAPDATLEERKEELYAILRVLTRVVNEDVQGYIEGGGRMLEPTELLGPLTPQGSSLKDDQWASAVERAADLLRRLPSQDHDELFKWQATPLQAVLRTIALGYQVSLRLQAVVDAAEDVVLQHDPLIGAEELERVLARSKGLATQPAGVNEIAFGAFRAALSLPEDSEGSYEPTARGWVDRSNLRFDAQSRKVVYRKPPSEFKVPKLLGSYPAIWAQSAREGHDVVVGDSVVDQAGARATLACPALARLEPGDVPPVVDQWDQLLASNRRRWALERPSVRPPTLPDDLAALLQEQPEVEVVEVDGVDGAEVEVVRRGGHLWVTADGDELHTASFTVEGGVLRIVGRPGDAEQVADGSAEAADRATPRIIINVPEYREVGVRSTGTPHVAVLRMTEADIAVPDGGTAVIDAVYPQVTSGAGADAVVLPSSSGRMGRLDATGPEAPATGSVTVLSNGVARDVVASGGIEVATYLAPGRPGRPGQFAWEVSLDDLPGGARRALAVAGAGRPQAPLLDLPGPIEAQRNAVRRRAHAVRQAIDPSEPAAPEVAAVLDALTDACRRDPATRSVLSSVVRTSLVSPPTQQLLALVVREAVEQPDIGAAGNGRNWLSGRALLAPSCERMVEAALAGAEGDAAEGLARSLQQVASAEAVVVRGAAGQTAELLDDLAKLAGDGFDPAAVVAAATRLHPGRAQRLLAEAERWALAASSTVSRSPRVQPPPGASARPSDASAPDGLAGPRPQGPRAVDRSTSQRRRPGSGSTGPSGLRL